MRVPVCVIMRALCALLPLGVPLLRASSARAEAGGLDVSIAAPCDASAETLRARVERFVGPAGVAEAHGSVRITREPKGPYRLDVALSDGERSLRDTDCSALVEAAAIMVALSINPELDLAALAEDAPPESGRTPDDTTPRAPASSAPDDDPATFAPKTRRVRFGGHLEAGATYGIVPDLSPVLGIGAHLEGTRVGILLTGRYVFARESDGTHRVRVDGIGTSLLLTAQPPPWLRVGLGAELYMLHGRGTRVEEPREAFIPVVAPQLAVAARAYHREKTSFWAALTASWAVVRPRFVVNNHGPVYRPPAFQLMLALRVAHDFL